MWDFLLTEVEELALKFPKKFGLISVRNDTVQTGGTQKKKKHFQV